MKHAYNFALSIMIVSSSLAFADSDLDSGREAKRGPQVFRKKDASHLHTSSSSSLMTYHGGSVFHISSTAAIFWGNSWNNATFAKDKISGLDLFFAGFGGSNYAQTGVEYYDGGGNVTNQSNYLGHLIDSTSPPSRALKTSQAVSEACKMTNNKPSPSTLYLIYTSNGAGNVNYCAWHSWGTCSNGAQIQIAYMPNLDGVAGCDPGDSSTGHSQGLAALANVTSHELMETITDPRGSAWYDSSGSENGDKCAWSFPPNGGISTFYGGSQWKLQMEWSNAAFSAGTGFLNRSNQKGCIF